jgi:hypothetical protein
MKLKTLILGTAMLPFVVAGGAQAADLAVAEASSACGAGGIPSGSVCILVGGHVRLVASGGSSTVVQTKGEVKLSGTTANGGATLMMQVATDTAGDMAYRIDNGTKGWVTMGPATLWFGFDALPSAGGGFTDIGARHPDGGGIDQVGASWGSATKVSIVGADTREMYTTSNGWQAEAQLATSVGGLAATITAGWVSANVTGEWVNAGIGGALGAAAWKVWAAWGNNANGGVTNRQPYATNATGTSWLVGGGFKLPLGGIISAILDASYESLNGGITSTQVVAGLNEQITPNADLKQEVSWDSIAGTTWEAWINWSFNGG